MRVTELTSVAYSATASRFFGMTTRAADAPASWGSERLLNCDRTECHAFNSHRSWHTFPRRRQHGDHEVGPCRCHLSWTAGTRDHPPQERVRSQQPSEHAPHVHGPGGPICDPSGPPHLSLGVEAEPFGVLREIYSASGCGLNGAPRRGAGRPRLSRLHLRRVKLGASNPVWAPAGGAVVHGRRHGRRTRGQRRVT